MKLVLTLAGSGVVPAVELPLYFDVAKGTARLTHLTCTPWQRPTSILALAVRPGVSEGRIGVVAPGEFANMGVAPSHAPATLVQLPSLAVIRGEARLSWANASDTSVPFTYADALAATKKTTSTTSGPASLVAELIGSLSTSAVGPDPVGAQAVTRDIVANALPEIDAVVLSTFTALGVNLGQVDTWVSGVRCGTSVMVL